MKKSTLFLKRLNRGLVLGIAVLLVLALWTVISAQVFKSGEKPEIEKEMREYLSDLAAFHADFEAQKCNHELTEAEINARMKSFSDFTKKYFTYRKSGTMSGTVAFNINEIEDAYREYLNEGIAGELLSLSLEPIEMPGAFIVRKVGPNRAVAEIALKATLRSRGVEYSSLWLPGMSTDNMMWVMGDETGSFEVNGSDATCDASKVYESRGEGQLTLHLQKIDGEWKIIFAGQSALYIYDSRIVEGGLDQ